LKHRTFIAIEVPREIGEEIAAVQKQLDKYHLPVAWEPVEKLHLTLAFLGKLDNDQLGVVRGRLRSIITEYPSFELRPAFLETLYQKHDSSLFYLAVVGDLEILKDLHKDIRLAMEELKIPVAERFMPHITIGRLHRTDPTATKQFLDKILDYELPVLNSFPVDRITLYESFLSRIGSTYRKVCQIMLK
jgi:RNA 2',3'-cyclic 3'-phosphodiesterase